LLISKKKKGLDKDQGLLNKDLCKKITTSS